MTLFRFTNDKGEHILVCAKTLVDAVKYIEGFDWVTVEKLYTNITIVYSTHPNIDDMKK